MVRRYRRWIGLGCVYFLLLVAARSQSTTDYFLPGVVLDSLTRAPLQYANVYCLDTLGSYPPEFALTDAEGQFAARLAADGVYEVTISYLGYRSRRFLWSAARQEREGRQTYYLAPTSSLLNEVTVVETMPPVVYKDDTIIYNAELFYTGRERKLRELLNKLPGVEVDRENTIYVNGQRIDKVLVEGEPFFGGNSELAVKSIPADAVSKVEVIKAFRAVPFLTSSQGNAEDIINIKLREDKKELVFGDAALSSSLFRRYQGNTNLFYYSPKLNLYTTQAANNNHVELLSIEQFVQLQGGFLSFVGPDGNSLRFDNGILPSLMAPPQVTEYRAQLSGAGIDYRMNEKLKLSSYFVYSNQNYATRQTSFSRIELAGNTTIEERIASRNRSSNQLVNANVTLEYRPRDSEFLSGQIVLRRNRSLRNPTTEYASNFGDNDFTALQAEAPDFAFAGLTYHRKLNDRETLSASLQYETTELDQDRQWSSQTAVFLDSLFPWIEQQKYTLLYAGRSVTRQLAGKVRYSRQLDRYHSLHLEAGGTGQRTRYRYLNWQQLDDAALHPTAGEGISDQGFASESGFAGLFLRRKIRQLTVETGLIGDFRLWQIGGGTEPRRRKFFPRPFVSAETDWARVGKIRLAYAQSARIPDYTETFTGTYIDNFNTLATGNPDLRANRGHNFDFSLQRYSLIRKDNFYFNARYSLTLDSVQDSIVNYGYGIERVPLNNGSASLLRARSRYAKHFGKYEVALQARLTDNRFRYRTAERDVPVRNLSLTAGFVIEKKTNRQNFIRFTYDRRRSDFRVNGVGNLLHVDELGLILSYRLWQNFLAEFMTEYYRFSGIQRSDYHTVGLDLRYNRENSPLTLTLSGNNLLNNTSIDSASLGAFTLSRRTDYTFPRTVLVGLGYQF